MHKIYRTIFILLVLLLTAASGKAQLYGNEWIDYNKTYYKFKVGKDGICHISKATLDAAAVPSTLNGTQFILYRDGVEVPIYTSTTSTFGSSDYIEFYGQGANGALDRSMFKDTSWQADPKASLFTDTAAYFLTYDNGNTHARYIQNTNSIPATPPPAETGCLVTVAQHYKDNFIQGVSYSGQDALYSSQFDLGEGYMHQQGVSFSSNTTVTLGTPNATGNGNAQINTTIIAVASTAIAPPIPFKISLNSQLIADSILSLGSGTAAVKKFSISAPASMLAASSDIQFAANYSTAVYTAYGNAYIELQYERNYDVSGLDNISFSLRANTNNQYLEFQNFNHGGTAPRPVRPEQ